MYFRKDILISYISSCMTGLWCTIVIIAIIIKYYLSAFD